MIVEIMPFIISIVLVICLTILIIVARALTYRERVEMLKRGYVPKGYQPINQQPQMHQPQMQQPQPDLRYELPQLPEQGAPMPFSTGDTAKTNRYDVAASSMDRHK